MTTVDTMATSDVLAWLRRHRGERRRKLGKAVYALYVVGLLLVIYGYPLFRSVPSTLGEAHIRADTGPVVAQSLLPALAGLGLVVVAVFVRDARWRGPVVLAIADVAWLLPLPIDRGRILRTRFIVSIVIAAVGGLAAGLLAAGVLHSLRPATGATLFLVAAAAATLLAVLGVSCALAVEASARAERVARGCSGVALLVGALLVGGAGVAAANGSHPAWSYDVISWSGPWGWGAYALDAVDRTGAIAPGVVLALGALAAAAVGATVIALRLCERIPTQQLRVRARTAQSVGAAVFLGDARQARLSIRATRAQGGRPSRRLRPPRSRHLVILWRDAVGVVRAPAQLGWTCTFAWGAIGVLAIGTAASSRGRPPILIVLVALAAGYAAAASVVETARLDGDDPQVASQLPLRFSGVAVRHGVVATVLLAVVGSVGWLGAVGLDSGLGPVGVVGIVCCAPVLVAAALFNAYRGRTPIEWLLTMSDAGGLLLAGWFLVGPLVAVAVLTPAVVHAFDTTGDPAEFSSALLDLAVVGVVATGLGLWAVSARARRRVASPREGGLLAPLTPS